MSSQYGLGGKHSRVEAMLQKQFVADHERGFLNKRPSPRMQSTERRWAHIGRALLLLLRRIGFDRHKNNRSRPQNSGGGTKIGWQLRFAYLLTKRDCDMLAFAMFLRTRACLQSPTTTPRRQKA
jgi:hypothetical protein